MTTATATTAFRCSACGATSTHPADDSTPVCNRTDACGLLFEDERIAATPAPPKRLVKFEASNRPEGGYAEGDEREYDVVVRGRTAGIVGPAWIVGATEGSGTYGWCANLAGGGVGEGRTRYEAVAAAFASAAR